MVAASIEAPDRIKEVCRPGKTTRDIAKAGSVPLVEAGYRPLILAHGWSMTLEAFHVYPYVTAVTAAEEWTTREPTIELKANMTLQIEIHTSDEEGRREVAVGNAAVVTNTGARLLQKYPTELIVV